MSLTRDQRRGLVVALCAGAAVWWAWPRGAVVPPRPEVDGVKARPAVVPRPVESRPVARIPTLPAATEPQPDGVDCVIPPGGEEAQQATVSHEALGKLALTVREGVMRLPVPAAEAPTYLNLDATLQGVGTVTGSLVRSDRGAWSCALDPVQRFAFVSGHVQASEGAVDGRIVVMGCGGRTRVDRDGGFYLETEPSPCSLVAVRRDGMFLLRSEPVEVDPTSGAEVVLELEMPPYKAAGVGLGMEAHELGVRVVSVFPDTPAAAAGLVEGDIVVALDDRDAAQMSVQRFVDFALGPEGTDVTYTVIRDGEEVDVVLTRAHIERPKRW